MGQARGPARATGDTIARSTGLAAVSQLSVAAFTAFLTLYLVRVLGPSEYGIFAVAVSVGALALLPSDLGISLSAARFIAERREEPTAAADILRDALRLKVVVGLVVSVALIVVAEPIAWIYGEPGLVWPIRAVSVAVFGQGLVLFFQRAFIALGRVAVGLRIVVSESAFEVGATVTLVMLGMGAGGAAFGRATGYLLGTLVAVVLTVRALGRRAVAGPGHVREAMRSIAGYAGALLVIEAAYTLFSQIDILLVGALLGPAAAGVFQAPVRLATFLGYPGLAIANGVAPAWPEERPSNRMSAPSSSGCGCSSCSRRSPSRRCWSGPSRWSTSCSAPSTRSLPPCCERSRRTSSSPESLPSWRSASTSSERPAGAFRSRSLR